MKYKNIHPCVGILGGGQLARMSALAAGRLGIDIAIFDKSKYSPAAKVSRYEFCGGYSDSELIKQFVNICDVITLENEFIDSNILKMFEKAGGKLVPSSNVIKLIQDKFTQKTVFNNAGLPVPKFVKVEADSSYKSLSKILGKKFLIKSRKLGYDGYGNALIENEIDFENAVNRLKTRHSLLMAEEFIPFEKELAVMVVRSKKEFVVYPLVETIQENHICKVVIAPADLNKSFRDKIILIAKKAVEAINGYGIFGFEFFQLNKNEILINEIAPRPHNSGHYTIDACVTSQFENHIRAVLNLPLGNTDLIYKSAVMINLLGKKNSVYNFNFYNKSLNNEKVHLHLYGKDKIRKGRKMGHITLCGNNIKKLLHEGLSIEKEIIY